MATVAIKGGSVSALPRKSRQYAAGRTCARPDCPTRLSTYNRNSTCFTHSTMKIPRLRGKKT